ncbi:DUF6527 family protein [Zunongwangia profunda]|uniref:DUF6527 family protein n=1 Tax=Zunongwangia profunda TaxID=398743 RepID=UPI00248E8B71|nr:DUF6527 family protein [Zunongwangia profunda]|tara:strand:+ start:1960 stop:2319 length:360 start_codon:yes stop_codon:yes gene_type:complete
MKPVIELQKSDEGLQAFFECPGCGNMHGLNINGTKRPNWKYTGTESKPTFSPSILTRWVSVPRNPEEDENGNYILGSDGRIKGAKNEVCHSFVTNGKIRFLNDCTHELAGKTVDLKPIE